MRFLCVLSPSERKPFCFISIRLFAFMNALPTGRISVKFYVGNLRENISRKFLFLKIGQKYGTLYINNQVVYIFNDDRYLKNVPLLKGCGINIVMLGEVVYLVYARLSFHTQIIYLVLKLSDFE